MTSPEDPAALMGRDVVDRLGEKVGTVRAVYRDATTGDPTWVALSTGWLGTRVSLLPYPGVWERGDYLVSRWDADTVKDGPTREDHQDARPGPEEEQELYGFYGEDWSEFRAAGHAPHPGLGSALPEPEVERRDRPDEPDELVVTTHSTPDDRVVLQASTPDGPPVTAELHAQSTTREIEGDLGDGA